MTPLSFSLEDVDSKIHTKHLQKSSSNSHCSHCWLLLCDIKQSSCTERVSMAATDPNCWTYRCPGAQPSPPHLVAKPNPIEMYVEHFSFQNDEHLSAAPTGSTPLERWCWAMKPRSHSKFQLILEHWAEHGSTHPFWPWELPGLTSVYNEGCILVAVMLLLYWWHELDKEELDCMRKKLNTIQGKAQYFCRL